MSDNLLIHTDNLTGLNYLLNNGLKGKVDLVYIDPPYATGGNFTITDGRATTIYCQFLLKISVIQAEMIRIIRFL
jgi:DNA modification methylase